MRFTVLPLLERKHRAVVEATALLQRREAGVLDAALDAAFPACGHVQMHELRQVVGRRLKLADGLLGQGLPLLPLRRDRVDRYSAFRSAG